MSNTFSKIELSILERFFDDFPQGGKLLILTHDHPDPDSISSAAALAHIAQVLGKAKTTIAYGGIIGRAENAHMVKYLKLKLIPVDKVKFSKYDKIAMCDTQPTTGNNALPDGIVPDLVIDHHPKIKATKDVPYVDIRLDYGATASILCEYLDKFDLQIDQSLATALLYGIKSETQDLGREAYAVDIESYLKLFPLANKKLLSKIVNPRVSGQYFKDLVHALQKAHWVGSALVSHLSDVDSPDIVPEVADLILRAEGCSWALCTGQYQGNLHCSIRTTNVRKDAGKLMKALMKSFGGTGGGHLLIAGGKISVPDKEAWQVHELQQQLEEKFLKRIKKHDQSQSKLIEQDL
ncbi:MAG TPA: DHH family phosphoesterase [Oligoflexia bacterium]|nr:DHH family phosphoesterase [Oligoflexia bacterium]HMR24038.1 DHH family phosphoesterase [Oligoflexia bacterium]